jgi:hypothetical protein
MKHNERIHDDELHLLDSINRMSRQLSFHKNKTIESNTFDLSDETIEDLEEQLEYIRNSQETHNHRKKS